MEKCPVCWKYGPPHQWSSKTAPNMPASKEDLKVALTPIVPLQDYPLTKPELRHLFRQLVRGERSPADPTKALSSLRHEDLVERMTLHNLPLAPKMTKDAMIFAIRGDTVNDSWDLCSEEASSHLYSEVFSKLHLLQHRDGYDSEVKAFFDACSKIPSASHAASKAAEAYNEYLAAKNVVLDQLLSTG
eukprot:s157_g28.t1